MTSTANLDICHCGISDLKSSSNKGLIFHTSKGHLNFVLCLSVAYFDNLLFQSANINFYRLGKVCAVWDDCIHYKVWRGLIIDVALVSSKIKTFIGTFCTSPLLIVEGAADACWVGYLLYYGRGESEMISFLWTIAYFCKFITFQGGTLQVKLTYLTINFGIVMFAKLRRQASWVVKHAVDIGGAWAIDTIHIIANAIRNTEDWAVYLYFLTTNTFTVLLWRALIPKGSGKS